MPVAVITGFCFIFEERNAMIYLGASSGIGRATALLFAKNKYQLSLNGRSEAALNDVVKECVQQGITADDVLVTPIDLVADNAPKTIIQNTLDRFNRIDTLVNSAGILRSGQIIDSDISVYDELFNVNVRCIVRLTREALPHIIKSKGTVVNVSSINGLCPFAGVGYYCMSKSAVDQFTKCLALEMAPHGVRVNAVNPGVTITNLHRRNGQDEKTYAAFLDKSKTTHALGRPAEPKEVAEAILFLASDKSSFTTGELLRVDGGRGIMHPR
ncbi:oxidoreductase, short chain dehydrogenase/reductase family protein [Dictyocaulus viviparus]|uniref:Oxidoreductase, short chain dehydrogenase/reductase family protein n=1 Tax=Dictyocaulus viviparus TaxID=29172 RepID=A0A0D8Y6E9_DICVI|nr:oxidoreductase, short chain dehydrogenase/reductase family protein [Dictyocaulus viviparus]